MLTLTSIHNYYIQGAQINDKEYQFSFINVTHEGDVPSFISVIPINTLSGSLMFLEAHTHLTLAEMKAAVTK